MEGQIKSKDERIAFTKVCIQEAEQQMNAVQDKLKVKQKKKSDSKVPILQIGRSKKIQLKDILDQNKNFIVIDENRERILLFDTKNTTFHTFHEKIVPKNQIGQIRVFGRIQKNHQQVMDDRKLQCNICGVDYGVSNNYRHNCQNGSVNRFGMLAGKSGKPADSVCLKCLKIKNRPCQNCNAINKKIWPNILTTRNTDAYQLTQFQNCDLNDDKFTDPQYVISFGICIMKIIKTTNPINIYNVSIKQKQKIYNYDYNRVSRQLGIPNTRMQIKRILVDIICVRLQKSVISIYDLFDHFIKSLQPFNYLLPKLSYQQILQAFDYMMRLVWYIDQQGLQIIKNDIQPQFYDYLKGKKYVLDSQLWYKNFNSHKLKGVFLTQPIFAKNEKMAESKRRVDCYHPQRWNQYLKQPKVRLMQIQDPLIKFNQKQQNIYKKFIKRQISMLVQKWSVISQIVKKQQQLIMIPSVKCRIDATNTTFTKEQYIKIIKQSNKQIKTINITQKIVKPWQNVKSQIKFMKTFNLFLLQNYKYLSFRPLNQYKMITKCQIKDDLQNKYLKQLIEVEYMQIQKQSGIYVIQCQTFKQAVLNYAKIFFKSLNQFESAFDSNYLKKLFENTREKYYFKKHDNSLTKIQISYNQLIRITKREKIINQYQQQFKPGQLKYIFNQNILQCNSVMRNLYIQIYGLKTFGSLKSIQNIQIRKWVSINSKLTTISQYQQKTIIILNRNLLFFDNFRIFKRIYQKSNQIKCFKLIHLNQQKMFDIIKQNWVLDEFYVEKIMFFIFSYFKCNLQDLKDKITSIFKIQQEEIEGRVDKVFDRLNSNQIIIRNYYEIKNKQLQKPSINLFQKEFCLQNNYKTKMIFDDEELIQRKQGIKLTQQVLNKIHVQSLKVFLDTEKIALNIKSFRVTYQYSLIQGILFDIANKQYEKLSSKQSKYFTFEEIFNQTFLYFMPMIKFCELSNDKIVQKLVQFCSNKKNFQSFQLFCNQNQLDFGAKNKLLYKNTKQQYQYYKTYNLSYIQFKQQFYKLQIHDFNQIRQNKNIAYQKDRGLKYQVQICRFIELLVQSKRRQDNFLRQKYPKILNALQIQYKKLQQIAKRLYINEDQCQKPEQNIFSRKYEQQVKLLIFEGQKFNKDLFVEQTYRFGHQNQIKTRQNLLSSYNTTRIYEKPTIIQLQNDQINNVMDQIVQQNKFKRNLRTNQTKSIKEVFQQVKSTNKIVFRQLTFFGQKNDFHCNKCKKKLNIANFQCYNQKCPWYQKTITQCQIDNEIIQPILKHGKTKDIFKIKFIDIRKSYKCQNQIQKFIKINRPQHIYSHIPSFMGSLRKQNIKMILEKIDEDTLKAIKQYNQYHMYMPLVIKQSLIQNAGLGVFSTSQIEENIIVSSYTGNIFKQYQVLYSKKNDSIVQIGFYDNNLITLSPQKIVNQGRYFNSVEDKNRVNMKMKFLIYQVQKDKYQFNLFLISTRTILNGEQLYWDYGFKFFEMKIHPQMKQKRNQYIINQQYEYEKPKVNYHNPYTGKQQYISQQQLNIISKWYKFEQIIMKTKANQIKCVLKNKKVKMSRYPKVPLQRPLCVGNFSMQQFQKFAKWQMQKAIQFQTQNVFQKLKELNRQNQWLQRIKIMNELRYGNIKPTIVYQPQPQPILSQDKIKQLKKQLKREVQIDRRLMKKNQIKMNKKNRKKINYKNIFDNLKWQFDCPFVVWDQDDSIVVSYKADNYGHLASIIKVLNLIVSFEMLFEKNIQLQQIIKVPKFKIKSSFSQIGIQQGDYIKITDLFRAMLLASSYQAASTLALYCSSLYFPQNTDDQCRLYFIDKMKKKALQIGMLNTQINDEIGGNSCFSKPEDLRILWNYIINNYHHLLEYFNTPNNRCQMVIRVLRNQKIILKNVTKTVHIPGLIGKSGYSTQHKRAYAGVFKTDKGYIKIVILGSNQKLFSCRMNSLALALKRFKKQLVRINDE